MIPPITGMLRKRMWLDGTAALGLGVAAGYTYWFGFHLKAIERQESFYLQLERQRLEAQK